MIINMKKIFDPKIIPWLQNDFDSCSKAVQLLKLLVQRQESAQTEKTVRAV